MMRFSRVFTALPALLLALMGCGGGGGAPAAVSGPPAVQTLAYVVTTCSENAQGNRWKQSLLIRQGERPPVVATELTYRPNSTPPDLRVCALFGTVREGSTSVYASAFQRLGILHDGSGVVFEVTDDFAFFTPGGLIPPEDSPSVEGIFFVRADGSGLRRLGPASRDAAFRFFIDLSTPYGYNGRTLWPFAVSPDNETVAFTDVGPGPGGEDTIQVFTLDIATGARFQVTNLPTAPAPALPPFTPTHGVWFRSPSSVHFNSYSNPDGLNPDGSVLDFFVNTDGTGLDTYVLPSAVVLPGSQIVPDFRIVGGSGSFVAPVYLPGKTPKNQLPYFPDVISEIFLFPGEELLQLTNFERVDTNGPLLSSDGQRAFFIASADPFGTNPTENCQWFSIDPSASDLRQLTDFRQGEHSDLGCSAVGPAPGCAINDPSLHGGAETGALVFSSTCDPFGTNPNGEQVFIMRPDGTELRALTDTAGMSTAPDGSVTVELPGPFVYAP